MGIETRFQNLQSRRFIMHRSLALVGLLLAGSAHAQEIKVEETDDRIRIVTDAVEANIRKKGYVSGIAAGSFLDKKTGAREKGFGLFIMDFLLGPGWKEGDS